MILNPHYVVAIALDEWHFWWPWVPVKMTCRGGDGSLPQDCKYWSMTRGWRWLYAVQRKRIYDMSTGKYMWTDYRDITGRMQ